MKNIVTWKILLIIDILIYKYSKRLQISFSSFFCLSSSFVSLSIPMDRITVSWFHLSRNNGVMCPVGVKSFGKTMQLWAKCPLLSYLVPKKLRKGLYVRMSQLGFYFSVNLESTLISLFEDELFSDSIVSNFSRITDI